MMLSLCRAEREADQIGLMILAAAGFDPRVAPPAFEKLGRSGRFLSTYPSSKKRAQLLSGNKIMEEALKLYREVSPNQHTEDSL
jgi:predicted Zn-dependent protease